MAQHQQLLEWIENELATHDLHLGDKLPADKELAARVGLSHSQVRESLKHCEEIGLLRLYEGRKRSIIGEIVRDPAVTAAPAMRLYLAGAKNPRSHLAAICLLLETQALSEATYEKPVIEELNRLLGLMQDSTHSIAAFHEQEADFHIQLGRLSPNPLFSALLATLREAMIEARFELVSQVPLWSSTATRLRSEYQSIVDAAATGDTVLAITLLRANMQERFAETGYEVELPAAFEAEEDLLDFNLEPLDEDTDSLVPDVWSDDLPVVNEAGLDAQLLQDLATVQPLGAERASAEGSSVRRTRETGLDRHEVIAPADSQPVKPRRKRFDVMGYFGFKQNQRPSPQGGDQNSR